MAEPESEPAPLSRTRRSVLAGGALGALGLAGMLATAAGLGGFAGHDLLPAAPPDRSGRPSGSPGSVGAPVLWRLNGAGRRTALTFDDGPDPRWTPRVLDALATHSATATFFMVGERAKRHPELVARVVAAGHEVGNHTWSHIRLDRVDLRHAADQLHRTHETLVELTGRAPTLFRPPWGDIDAVGLLAAAQYGYRVVLWSDLVRGAHPATDLRKLLNTIRPGAIVLGHDGGPTPNAHLMTAFHTLVARLTSAGHTLTTLTDALTQDGFPQPV
jgi:peptidoglycan/xylan/chitin deacetylase (PgdA/CDA1 family)